MLKDRLLPKPFTGTADMASESGVGENPIQFPENIVQRNHNLPLV